MSQNLDFDPSSVAIKPAATVMLLRESDEQGVEVFMMRRTTKAAFAGGMYVFPGGAVDAEDSSYEIAAIRECFEEAGVLLARRETTGDVVRFDAPEVIERFNTERHNIHDGSIALLDLCAQEGLRLTTDDIHYVSHWITPMGEKRRFDTRFFIARAPAAQEPLHADGETIESFWIKPEEAIRRSHEKDLMLMPPTKANIEFLLPHKTTDEVMAAASKVGTPQTILPKIKIDSDGRVTGIAMPGDSDYDAL